MPMPFEGVSEQLLRAGIAPRHVRRYVTELREHLADLTAQERGAGLDEPVAAERARALLGTDAQLVQTMLDRSPRSLTVRAPWTVFVLLPAVALVALIGTVAKAMIYLMWPVHAAWPGGVPDTYTSLIATVSFVASYLPGPALAAGCIVLALRQRLSSAWIWIGFGVIALFSGSLGFYMNILPPVGGHARGAVFSVVPSVFVKGQLSGAATSARVALRAAVLFAIAAFAYGALRTRLMGPATSPPIDARRR